MEPRIQYAQTVDGVSIAFWTLGEGTPLVHLPPLPWSHIQLEWQDTGWRRWYELLARNRMLVRYDARGAGLSDRDVGGFSLDAYLLDLEAVVERLGLKTIGLFVAALRDKDWEGSREATAPAMLGWSAPREAPAMAFFMRECLTQEAARAAHE